MQNAAILEHERLRKIEAELYAFAEQLRMHGAVEKEVEERVMQRREELNTYGTTLTEMARFVVHLHLGVLKPS